MNNISKRSIANGVNFINIKDSKFKTSKLSFNMLMPLKDDTVSANAILPFILRRSCKKYPNFTQLKRKLANLYGASIYADVRKLGEVQLISLSAVFLDDKYALNKEVLSGELTDLLCNMIFEPNIENEEFNADDINQEKRQLIETIDSEYNDKRLYAKNRCEEIMCSNEAYGINVLGKKEQVERLTNKDIYSAWLRILKSARIEIILLGNVESTSVYTKFEDRFKNIKRGDIVDCSTNVIKEANQVKEINETIDISQAKLVMGFRTNSAVPSREVDATRLMSALFGETPQSKLFLNVREKLGLCYYCSSSYCKEKGIMFVQSGVNAKNIDTAKTEIIKQLNSIKAGDFSDEDLKSTKLSLSNSLTSLSDYLSRLESWYLSQLFSETIKSPEEKVDDILNIDKKAVMEAANKVTLDTVYMLVGEGNE